MIKNCFCKKDTEFFDLEYLKKSKSKVDNLIDEVRFQNPNLKNYYRQNNALVMFNDVTVQLVKDFRYRANAYINHLITNKHEYGILYLLAQEKTFNVLYIEYTTFPLVHQPEKKEIMKEIEKMANNHFKDPLMNKITCLELLYFYALLVNPNYNWIIMDYISNGNKNHQYVMLYRHRQI